MVVTTYSLQQIELILMLFIDTNLRFGAECKVLLADFRDHKAGRKINKPVGCSLYVQKIYELKISNWSYLASVLLTLHVITFLLFLINFYFKLLRFSAKGGKRFFRPIWRTCRHLEFWQFYANLVVHFHREPECACGVVSRTTVPSSSQIVKGLLKVYVIYCV